MKKILILIIFLALGVFLFWSYRSWFKTDSFRAIFFDVGQGDSALVVTPGGQTILIDGGPDNKVLRGLEKILPFWRRTIDLLIITHAHDDHVTGLIEVSKRYKIKNILYNNLAFKTPALDALIKVFKENKFKMTSVETGMIFKLDNNCSINILQASKDTEKDQNDYSIVSMFNCLGRKILFSGDAGVGVEKKLLSSNLDLSADIFKVSHHGSFSANSLDFLKVVNPKIAVISVGIDNKFGHPASLILNRLKELAVDIYRTDKQGSLIFLANHQIIKLAR